MKTRRKTVASYAADVLAERGETTVTADDGGLLDLIGIRAGMRYLHPADRWKRVLNALGRSPLFKKSLTTLSTGRQGRRFVLVTPEAPPPPPDVQAVSPP